MSPRIMVCLAFLLSSGPLMESDQLGKSLERFCSPSQRYQPPPAEPDGQSWMSSLGC
jgi:hypothetical protein